MSQDTVKQAFARERLTVSNAVKTLTESVYADTSNFPTRKATRARIVVENYDIRVTNEGTDAVATTTGTKLAAGSIHWLDSYGAIAKFKRIRDTASDAVIEVEYYR